jgi:hypothetical protein
VYDVPPPHIFPPDFFARLNHLLQSRHGRIVNVSYRPTQNDCDSFQAGAIIHAILRLGTLALPVIVEGVETEEQRSFLARDGCQVQGYLIGRPEPIAHYRHLVAGLAGARESIVGAR